MYLMIKIFIYLLGSMIPYVYEYYYLQLKKDSLVDSNSRLLDRYVLWPIYLFDISLQPKLRKFLDKTVCKKLGYTVGTRVIVDTYKYKGEAIILKISDDYRKCDVEYKNPHTHHIDKIDAHLCDIVSLAPSSKIEKTLQSIIDD